MAAALLLPLLLPAVSALTITPTVPLADPADSGCLILARLEATHYPPVVMAMQPICPSSIRVPSSTRLGSHSHTHTHTVGGGEGGGGKWWSSTFRPEKETDISWVLGEGTIAIYAEVERRGGISRVEDWEAEMGVGAGSGETATASAGCVMLLDPSVLAVHGADFLWDNEEQALWNSRARSYVSDSTGAPISCGHSREFLPDSLRLPDPYTTHASDPIWEIPITVGTSSVPPASLGHHRHGSSSPNTPSSPGRGSRKNIRRMGSVRHALESNEGRETLEERSSLLFADSSAVNAVALAVTSLVDTVVGSVDEIIDSGSQGASTDQATGSSSDGSGADTAMGSSSTTQDGTTNDSSANPGSGPTGDSGEGSGSSTSTDDRGDGDEEVDGSCAPTVTVTVWTTATAGSRR